MELENFFGKNYHYIWSDNWCLDGDKAWYMAGAMDALFCLDLKLNKTIMIDHIPSDNCLLFRQHPIIMKKNDIIICFPDNGNDIWIYRITEHLWSCISVSNPLGVRISCQKAWFIKDKLYIVALGLKQIIELDLKKQKIDHYYNLSENRCERLAESVLINEYIYTVSSDYPYIYKFNCIEKSLKKYDLSEIDDQFQTICYDGNQFYLSGRNKKIYIWNEETEKLIILDEFPSTFGIWNFSGKYKRLLNCKENLKITSIFLSSVYAGDFIWFIPFQANEILYMRKGTSKINIFRLQEEMQTDYDMSNQLLNAKFLLQYVKSDRYIGLFSLKNKWLIEIDSWKLEYKILNYDLDEKIIQDIKELVFQNMMERDCAYVEYCSDDLKRLLEFCLKEQNSRTIMCKEDKKKDFGKKIYSYVKH